MWIIGWTMRITERATRNAERRGCTTEEMTRNATWRHREHRIGGPTHRTDASYHAMANSYHWKDVSDRLRADTEHRTRELPPCNRATASLVGRVVPMNAENGTSER